jgi:D-3-phosphoglycerate dehydrogenase
MPAAGPADCDALILLAHRFARESVPSGDRLAAAASASVMTMSILLPATTTGRCGHHTDGAARGGSIITYVLALSQKLLIKTSSPARARAAGRRVDHMGEGLVGKTLGQLGMGNIGAEVSASPPFGMNFIAHDPYMDEAKGNSAWIRLLRRAFPAC